MNSIQELKEAEVGGQIFSYDQQGPQGGQFQRSLCKIRSNLSESTKTSQKKSACRLAAWL